MCFLSFWALIRSCSSCFLITVLACWAMVFPTLAARASSSFLRRSSLAISRFLRYSARRMSSTTSFYLMTSFLLSCSALSRRTSAASYPLRVFLAMSLSLSSSISRLTFFRYSLSSAFWVSVICHWGSFLFQYLWQSDLARLLLLTFQSLHYRQQILLGIWLRARLQSFAWHLFVSACLFFAGWFRLLRRVALPFFLLQLCSFLF